MRGYLVGRVVEAFVTLLALSAIVFLLARVTGSPANLMLPSDATQAEVEQLEANLGLKSPVYVQYARFLLQVVQGDLGKSLHSRRSVSHLFFARFPATAQLTLLGLLVLVAVGVPLGSLSAVSHGRPLDYAVRVTTAFAQAAPTFWLGLMLMLFAGVWLGVLPVAGRSGWTSAILPTVCMTLWPLSGVIRLTRSGMLAELSQDYVLCARAKGLSESALVVRHVLRNSLIPVVTFSGVVVLSSFLTGSVVVETIFAWPGVGYLAYESIVTRDFPVLQGVVLIFGAMFILSNLLVDISYSYLDPRIRLGE